MTGCPIHVVKPTLSKHADGERWFFVSIYTLPVIFVYCFVEKKLNFGYIFCNSNTERSGTYYRLSTHIIRGLIIVHDFTFIVLISVSVIFLVFEFFFNFFVLTFLFSLAKLRTRCCKLATTLTIAINGVAKKKGVGGMKTGGVTKTIDGWI